MANQTLSAPIQKELFEIRGFNVVMLPRVSVMALIQMTRLAKQECLGKHWIPSNRQQCVWLEELLTVSQFKKSLMSALLLTTTCIGIEEFYPSQLPLGKTSTDKSVCENPDLAQCSVEVVDEAAKERLRVKEESYRAYIEEELSLRKRLKEIHQARPWRHWAAGE